MCAEFLVFALFEITVVIFNPSLINIGRDGRREFHRHMVQYMVRGNGLLQAVQESGKIFFNHLLENVVVFLCQQSIYGRTRLKLASK